MIVLDLRNIKTEIRYNTMQENKTKLLRVTDACYDQIFREGDTRKPTHIIIYPANVEVAHCPVCLEKAINKYGFENLVLHDFGHINLNPEVMNGREDVVTALYWGYFGDRGHCHECMGIPPEERPID